MSKMMSSDPRHGRNGICAGYYVSYRRLGREHARNYMKQGSKIIICLNLNLHIIVWLRSVLIEAKP